MNTTYSNYKEDSNRDISKELEETFDDIKNKLKKYKELKFIEDKNEKEIRIYEDDEYRIITGNKQMLYELFNFYCKISNLKKNKLLFYLDPVLQAYYHREVKNENS